MEEIDIKWDQLLKIHTTGRDDSDSDTIKFPYEPTPYSVLERIAGSGYIGKRNVLLDYGSGKGRVDFFLSYQCGCRSIGVEYNERIIARALANKEKALSRNKVEFICTDAEEYIVPSNVDRIYFFNPFSVLLLVSVMENIRESLEENERRILLFFYYPSKEYLSFLNSLDNIKLIDELDMRDLYVKEDIKEKVLVYEMIN